LQASLKFLLKIGFKMKTRFGAILTFSIMLLALASTTSFAQTNGNAQDRVAGQNGSSETAKEAEKVKGEVDLKLDELKARHETVLFACLESTGCEPLSKGQTVDGHLITEEPKQGNAINLPKPAYPLIARAAHASGRVEVQVVIDEEGKVIAAQAISGHPLLHAAALKAAREATFTPILVDGKPFKMAGVLNYNFNL
jgi:TonB family protein